MNEHEKVLMATVVVCTIVLIAVGLMIPESREGTAMVGMVLLAVPFIWSDRISKWMERKSEETASISWHHFWIILSLPFTTVYFVLTGNLP